MAGQRREVLDGADRVLAARAGKLPVTAVAAFVDPARRCRAAVIAPERRFYFGGDTGMFPGFADIGEKLGPFDLAAVPIGAYEPQSMMRPYHLDPEQAVQAARDVRARLAMGMHFGTFDLSDEPLDEPPRRFRAAGAAAGLAEGDVWVLAVGETRQF